VQELGGSTARETAKLANGNIPHHRRPAQFMNGDWLGDRNLFVVVFPPLLSEFKFSLVQELELFQEFSLLGEFCEICNIHEFQVLQPLLGD